MKFIYSMAKIYVYLMNEFNNHMLNNDLLQEHFNNLFERNNCPGKSINHDKYHIYCSLQYKQPE